MRTDRLYVEKVLSEPARVGDAVIGRLALVYADAFAGKPWDEYTVSPEGKFFGRETSPGMECPDNCGGKLELAYPPEKTAGYIEGELERPDAALLLLRDGDKNYEIVGFSWGFSYDSPEAFAADKYKTTGMRSAIASLLRGRGVKGSLWYLSESGILDDPEYRGRGLSRVFHEERLEVAKRLGLPAVQRTMNPGPMYRTSIKTMTQILGPRSAVDPVTGLGEADGVVAGLDRENQARVLFMRP